MNKTGRALPENSRRQFLKATAIGVAGAALGVRPGFGAPKTMTLMHENSFIKTFDEYFQKTLIPAYEKLTGVKIKYELVSVGGLQTRVTTVAETGSGPDMTLNFFNWPFLYDEKYLDVGDVAEEVGKKNGGWHDAAKEAVIVNGKWKAIPFGNVGQLMNWRTDWFKEAGYDKFPDTWDELLEAGTKLKANGHPFGFELGHGFGDNHGWLYPLLWSYGGARGRTRRQDGGHRFGRDGARGRFCPHLLPEDHARGCARLDRSQQQQGLFERTNILHQQRREHPVGGQARFPRHRQGHGPVAQSERAERRALPYPGAVEPLHLQAHPGSAGCEGFPALADGARQVGGWYASADSYYAPYLHAFDDAPLWHVEPRNIPYRDSLATSHLPGWPAPVSRAQSESVAKYVVVDMFAKACAGKSTKEVIADANAQLKQIYRPA